MSVRTGQLENFNDPNGELHRRVLRFNASPSSRNCCGLCLHTHCTTWRLPTERSNTRYLLERPATHKIAQESLSVVDRNPRRPGVLRGWFEEWNQYLREKEQVSSTGEVDEVARCQRVLPYHSKMEADVCERNLLRWNTGVVRWILSPGLGAGIDIANVKVVVHWGIPTDVLEWVQMAGRGGRGIEWSYSITVEPQNPIFQRQYLYRSAEETHPDRRQIMLDIISSRECIRPILSTFLDGLTAPAWNAVWTSVGSVQ